MVKAVVGANWGDEGKGKITDMLAEKADIIIRFQGGAMPAIRSSTIMANLRCIHCLPVSFTGIPQILSAMELPWISRYYLTRSSLSWTEACRRRRSWYQTGRRS